MVRKCKLDVPKINVNPEVAEERQLGEYQFMASLKATLVTR
jgi:hypothetical protein